jgi:ribonuclease P protein component
MFDLLSDILNELKDIPGLTFLKSLHGQLLSKKLRVSKSIENTKTRTRNVTSVSSRVGNAVERNKVEKRRKE